MPDLKFNPVAHDHQKFLAKARTRDGFVKAYEALAIENRHTAKATRPSQAIDLFRSPLPAANKTPAKNLKNR